MALFKKKEKQEEQPEFYQSVINTPARNYSVYKMKEKEKLLYFIIAFVVGAVVGYLFYGGIGQDEYGATIVTYICNVVICALAGFGFGRAFVPIRNSQIINSRTRTLRTQFISLLDSLSTSIAAGNNVPMAFSAAREDLVVQFSEDSYIVEELDIIIEGLRNGVPIESMLADFGKRSGIKDIENFGMVFETSYRRGANMKDVIRNTHDILCKKILIEAEIETKITSGKNELNVMLLMPLLIVGMMKFSGGDFAANFVTPSGLVSTTIAIGLFIAAFFVGRTVMKIEV